MILWLRTSSQFLRCPLLQPLLYARDKKIIRETGYQRAKVCFYRCNVQSLLYVSLHYALETLYHWADYSDAKPRSDS